MNNKKSLMISVIGILGLIAITVGVTFAFFSYAKQGTTENTITTGTITFLYTEVSGVGKGISLIDSYPISDSQGKNLTGEGKVFDFKVTSTNNMNASIPYEITARKKSGSTLDEKAVKIYLTKVSGDSEEEVLLDNYSNLTQTSKVDEEKQIEKTLYTSKVPASVGNYEQAYRLRMWIDEGTDFSPVEDNNGNITYPYNNKEFTVTVNVYANAKVVTEEEEEVLKNTNINTLLVNDTELTNIENQNYDYTTTLPAGTTSTTIDVETSNPNATVEIEKIDSLAYSSNVKRLSIKKTFEVNPGDNYFKVTVTSEDEVAKKEYKIKIIVLKDTDNTLKSLSLTDCPLNETFDKKNTNYTCTMTNNVDTTTVIAETNSSKAKVTGLGENELITGENTIILKVTSESGSSQEYIITVTKPEFKESLTIFNKTFELVTDEPTLTTSAPSSGDTHGLYKSIETNSGNPTYYFRGKQNNNYVKFADKIWRIIRINEDGTIRLLLDSFPLQSVYNADYTNRDSLYYTNSTLKTKLNSWYETNITKKELDNNVASGEYFCEQAKAAYDSGYASNSGITMTVYSKYTPNFKCSDDGYGYGIVDSNVGLISYDEYIFAGGYPDIPDPEAYLPFVTNEKSFWTMSPSGVYSAYDASSVWLIVSGLPSPYETDYNQYVRPVINLKADVTATGNGTSGSPWVIQ